MASKFKEILVLTILIICAAFWTEKKVCAQGCEASTPTYYVDLTGYPDSTWFSDTVPRDGICCNAPLNEDCIHFIVKLDPEAQGIIFNSADGAIPQSFVYTVDCGDSTSIGTQLCLSGVGPFSIVFCKPGNNPNGYKIQSVPRPNAGVDILVNEGCTGVLASAGYDPASITWTSVSPGAGGDWDSYLICPNCDTTGIIAQPGYPDSVYYEVCGIPLGSCVTDTVCDTVITTFATTLFANPGPLFPTVCFGGTTTNIFTAPVGGIQPYSVTWSTLEITDTISVGAGTYYVTIDDATDCPPASDSITVTQFLSDIEAVSGPDQTVCSTTFPVELAGTVIAASGGTWTGNGTFSPSVDSLNAAYSPTVAETTAGIAELILTTTGNGSCSADTDTMQILILDFNAQVSFVSSNITCNGANDGSADVTIVNGNPPFTINWNTLPPQTGNSATNITAGVYTASIVDVLGCDTTIDFTIIEPPVMSVTSVSVNAGCADANDGSVDVTVTGGVSPYSFSWSSGQTTEDLASLYAGSYTFSILDSFNCQDTLTSVVTEPFPLTASSVENDVTCSTANDGAINITVSGGITPYTYNWSSGQSIEDLTGISGGMYSVTITASGGFCQLLDSLIVVEPLVLESAISGTNALCFGSSDGNIDLAVSGGTTPYTYSWLSGQSTEDLANIVQGTYNVTITDSNNCTTTNTITISEPALLSISSSYSHITCYGADDGTIDITVGGGTTPYAYSWNSGQTTEDLSELTFAIYTATVLDSNNCSVTISNTINEPTQLTVTYSQNNISCNAASDGDIDLTVSGGRLPYTFTWSNFTTTEDQSGLIPGDYYVTTTDSSGCQILSSMTVTEPMVLLSSITPSNALCFGSSDGNINLSVSGGTTPYTYSWLSGQSTEDLANIAQGTYEVTITDSNNCTTANSVLITEPEVLSETHSFTNISCYGLTNGSIDIIVEGGIVPYSYSWSSGQSSEDLTNIGIGTYTVTVLDSNFCSITITETINQPSALAVDSLVTNVSCFSGFDASINITVNGGTPPNTFIWSTGETSEDLVGIQQGTYSVTVENSAGCEVIDSIIVTEPDELLGTVDTTDVSCNGQGDGAIDISITGGSVPYLFLWSTGASTQNISGLSVGFYDVTITDNNFCSLVLSGTITEPGILTVILNTDSISCYAGSDGGITTAVTGGTPGYQYLWSNGATGDFIVNLNYDEYVVTVIDSNNCQAISFDSVYQPAVINLSSVASQTSCYAGNDGSIDLISSGGSPPYFYIWNTGKTTAGITSVLAATYTVTLTDNNGCTSTISTIVTEPDSIILLLSKTDVNCYDGMDGSISSVISGGTSPYTFSWSNGDTNQNPNSLSAGTYIVTASDNNSCQTEVSIQINQPDQLSVAALISNISCNGAQDGSIDITASGGISPYVYLWSQGSTIEDIINLDVENYAVTITDMNACTLDTSNLVVLEPNSIVITLAGSNTSCYGYADGGIDAEVIGGILPYFFLWSEGSSTEDVNGLITGTYQVIVTDSNSCTESQIISIAEPDSIYIQYAAVDALCQGSADGSIDISMFGGTSPYYYLWSTGSTLEDVEQLTAGNYIVTATDILSCQAVISITINQPDSIILTYETSSVLCYGSNEGSIDLSVTGGSGSYTYLWATGETTQDLNSLLSGQYLPTVTDVNSCTANDTIPIFEPLPLTATTQENDVSCNGGSNGSAIVNTTGGTSPYSFLWDANANSQTDSIVSDLLVGVYFVTVSDFNNCTTTDSANLYEPEPLTSVLTSNSTTCFDGSDGDAMAIISGGTPPYSYNWEDGQTSLNAVGLPYGIFILQILDSNNCFMKDSILIDQPDQVVVSSNGGDTICPGESSDLFASAIGGAGSYSYLWQPGAISGSMLTVSPANTTMYYVMATDNLGCESDQDSIGVYVRNIVLEDFNCYSTGEMCYGSSTSIYAVHNTEYDGYSYLWSGGIGTGLGPYTVAPEATTEYYLTITDACGTTTVDTIKVGVYYPPEINMDSSFTGGCEPYTTQLLDPTLDTTAYSFNWDFGDGTTSSNPRPYHTYAQDGLFTVTLNVSSLYDCGSAQSSTGTVTVFPNDTPIILPDPTEADIRYPTIDFSTASDIYTTYLWGFGVSDSSVSSEATPSFMYPDTGSYTVTLYTIDSNNCENSTETIVVVIPVLDIDVPNAFSPNPDNPGGGFYNINDPNNDIFYPILKYTKEFDMKIFNRWGELIFISNDPLFGWDGYYRGKICKQDVYVYLIEVTFLDKDETHITKAGDVTLIR